MFDSSTIKLNISGNFTVTMTKALGAFHDRKCNSVDMDLGPFAVRKGMLPKRGMGNGNGEWDMGYGEWGIVVSGNTKKIKLESAQ